MARTSTILRPLRDRVVIEPIEAEEKTPGGIVLPDNAKEKPVRGKVLAVGSGRVLQDGTRLEMEISEGDEVIYSKYAGTDVTVDGETYIVLREDDILAVL